MNEELEKALAVILQKATQGVDAGVAFLSEQIPEVVRQLLIWHAVKSAIACVLFFALTCWLIHKAKYLRNLYREEGGEWDTCALVVGFFALISGGIALDNHAWLQILIAPKIYLIEYAAHLISK